MDIDATDYALLACVADADSPVWKKRIRDRLQSQDPALPGRSDISTQTVGRRISEMHDQGLVDTTIVEAPDAASNLIIGYVLTEDGRDVLAEKRRDIIGSYAFRTDQEEATEFIDRRVLVQLLEDEIGIATNDSEVFQGCDVEELLMFSLMYHTRRLADTKLDEQTESAFTDILQNLKNTGILVLRR